MSGFGSNPDFLVGGRTFVSAECRASVGQAAQFCLLSQRRLSEPIETRAPMR
jgi:hypothetical protein